MSNMTDFLENKIIDWLLRGQAIGITGASAGAGSGPANLHIGLFTANPTDAGGGTEVSTSGTNYGRASVASSLANWAGTQGAGTTVASSGTGGVTSNNAAIVFPAPGGTGWGSITGFGIFDAATGGNLLIWGALGTAKTVNANDAAPQFNAATLQLTFA